MHVIDTFTKTMRRTTKTHSLSNGRFVDNSSLDVSNLENVREMNKNAIIRKRFLSS